MSSSEPRDWLQIDPTLSFKRDTFAPLLELWRQRRVGDSLPARRDFEPHDLHGHLGWVVLVDVECDPERFRYRLVGSEVTGLIGRDMTGRYLDEAYPPEMFPVVTAGYRATVSQRQPLRLHAYYRTLDKSYHEVEALQLPLANDGDHVDMLMVRVVIERRGDCRPDLPSTST